MTLAVVAVLAATAILVTVLVCTTYVYGPTVRSRLARRRPLPPDFRAWERELKRKEKA